MMNTKNEVDIYLTTALIFRLLAFVASLSSGGIVVACSIIISCLTISLRADQVR